MLKAHGVETSMDGKGRWVDNVLVEWLWRSVKCEGLLTGLRGGQSSECRARTMLRVAQHHASTQLPGPTHAGSGAFRAGHPQIAGVKPMADSTYRSIQLHSSVSGLRLDSGPGKLRVLPLIECK